MEKSERKNLKDKTKKWKSNQEKPSFDGLLALQKQQIEIKREKNERYEKLMRETLEEQMKSSKEEWERDRELFL